MAAVWDLPAKNSTAEQFQPNYSWNFRIGENML